MAKLISAICIATFALVAEKTYVKPGQTIDLPEEDFNRLANAGCVREITEEEAQDISTAAEKKQAETPAAEKKATGTKTSGKAKK